MAPLISSTESSSPPKYFSSRASSLSATISSSFSRYSAAWSTRSAGISSMVGSAPISTVPRQVIAFCSIRSTTPSKLSSAPIGS
ncbi:Uncharacterised protein [Mycobacteroides abscessus subsp. abscessus]|nr:Uncharacterised protein [Mycobacteroides abscessus subsp. abscessus]